MGPLGAINGMKKPVMPSGRTPSNPAVAQQMKGRFPGGINKMGLGPSPKMMPPPPPPMNPPMGQSMGQMGQAQPMQPMNTGPQTTGMVGNPSGQMPGLFNQQYPQASGLGPSIIPNDPNDPRRRQMMGQ